jgi:hypothetical protein
MALAGVGYPQSEHFRYQPWPEDEGVCVEFRLTYRGNLPAQPSERKEALSVKKHAIRRYFHPQMKELWRKHITLKRYLEKTQHTKSLYAPGAEGEQITAIDITANDFVVSGYRFAPLVNNKFGLACSLDILFLRRDEPGALISGGDIDNRIKVLFDSLRMPKLEDIQYIGTPQAGENPFFCLLEDDNLITDVKITTDRLLTPMEQDEQIHDVHLVLHITIKILDPHKAALYLGTI